MMTRRQRDLLTFIEQFQNANGITPSYDEMMMAMELKSKSGVHALVLKLEERGLIRRMPNRARCIEVVQPGSANQIAAKHDLSTIIRLCGSQIADSDKIIAIKAIAEAIHYRDAA